MPLVFDTASDESVMYLYSRKNGGLERDYHHFVLEPTYLSQGNGHYRSFLQNHLTDTWFFPEVEDLNTSTFLNLIQTDGYNPQIITRRTYTAEDTDGLEEWLKDIVEDEELHNKLIEMVSEPFTPGEFIMKLEEGEGQVPQDYERNIRNLLRFCRENDVGDLHEGFWIDHWTYNLDLIDNFLEIYPEKLKETLIDRKTYTFYDNPDFVKPRDEKHVLADGQVRQYNAVARSSEKLRMIEDRDVYPTRMRADYGDGEIYRTNLLVKLLTLLANKIATLDPQGIGTEMEAGQPGWCDSLNGLPGLLGSSLCETLELKRLCQFIRGSLDRTDLEDECSIALYEELHDLMTGLSGAIDKRLESDSDEKALNYWRESNQLKEQYRKKTKMGISGQEEEMTVAEVNSFLNKCLELLDEIFKPENKEKILDENGVPYTYFINEVEKYEPIWKDEKEEIPKTGPSGQPLVRAKKFSQKPVPLFLEGPVHFSRVSQEDSKEVYGSVRESQLYDEKLKMYKNCESLEEEPFEIGRIRAYARGWIENESIYLHMEYKWLLELLRTGLYEEFFQEIENTLIPFLDPETYGRSILEGGSFIVSSAFPDEKLHGRCFQPRLSGVTNEMLRIWTWMVAGKNPFSLDENGQIKLGLRPILPSWLFTQEEKTARYYGSEGNVSDVTIQENAFAFKFLGRTLVVYHNEERKDTFGDDGAQAESYRLKYHDGTERTVTEGTLGPSMAEDVRNGRVERIDVPLS